MNAQTGSPFQSSVWCGNVTATSASVVARLNAPALRVRLAVSASANLASPVYSGPAATIATAGNTVTLPVNGLKPDTEYFYGLEVAGVLRAEPVSRGRFRTFPLARGSFKIVFSGDSDYRHADQRVFEAIAAERPLLFFHLGDLHYSDTNSTVVDDYRANYDSVLNHPAQGAFYRSVPVAYMWGDHDYCGNNSDGTATGRDAARAAYRERVPHYPFPATTGGTMAQAFTIGRVRVIVTDTRSASSAVSARDTAAKTRLGGAQKAWLKQELISARDGGFPLILWANPDPWIAAPKAGDDTWGGYATERTEIANFIRDNRISNVVSISADMHALAYDDGTNSDYATGGGGGLVVLHGAALTANGSAKGGPYTAGPIEGSQQYGVLEVYDNGGPSVACRFVGMKAGEGPKLTYIFSSSTTGGGHHSLVNISTLARVTSATDSITSGFVLAGTTPRRVLVRAVGPTLAAFGVADALAEPVLHVFQADRAIATNRAWATTAVGTESVIATFDAAGAFRFADENSKDAALVLTLQPAAYTVQITSGNGATGAALVEVYELP